MDIGLAVSWVIYLIFFFMSIIYFKLFKNERRMIHLYLSLIPTFICIYLLMNYHHYQPSEGAFSLALLMLVSLFTFMVYWLIYSFWRRRWLEICYFLTKYFIKLWFDLCYNGFYLSQISKELYYGYFIDFDIWSSHDRIIFVSNGSRRSNCFYREYYFTRINLYRLISSGTFTPC